MREADKGGLSVSSQFTGHGIGRVFHRPPWILHDCIIIFPFKFDRLLNLVGCLL